MGHVMFIPAAAEAAAAAMAGSVSLSAVGKQWLRERRKGWTERDIAGREMEGIVPVAKNGSERGNDFCGQ